MVSGSMNKLGNVMGLPDASSDMLNSQILFFENMMIKREPEQQNSR